MLKKGIAKISAELKASQLAQDTKTVYTSSPPIIVAGMN